MHNIQGFGGYVVYVYGYFTGGLQVGHAFIDRGYAESFRIAPFQGGGLLQGGDSGGPIMWADASGVWYQIGVNSTGNNSNSYDIALGLFAQWVESTVASN